MAIGGYTRFSKVPQVNIQRSTFNLSHSHKTTFNGSKGEIVPIGLFEVLPGDTFKADVTGFVRLATPLKPVMDNLYLDVFWFFVPNRIVWDGKARPWQDAPADGSWAEMLGEDYDPANPVHYQVPKGKFSAASTNKPIEGLMDYYGLPILAPLTDSNEVKFSSLPAWGYREIFWQWFRDENLQLGDLSDYEIEDADGNNTQLLPRGKRHDYFTGCLPYPQKGDPIGVPILGNGSINVTGAPTFYTDTPGVNFPLSNEGGDVIADSFQSDGELKWGDPGLEVSLTEVSSVSINDLRVAIAFQRLLERDMRGGTRMNEIIESHFAVTNPDARLQRSEFLGGGSSRINIRQVEQTTPDTDSGVGDLGAYGTCVLRGNRITKSFSEHGYIHCLINVRADLSYQQGMPRHFLRDSKYDFYWPELANIGEGIVWNLEIYTGETGTEGFPGYAEPITKASGYQDPFENWLQTNPDVQKAGENGVFGYQERWSELRFAQNMITGKFRSDYAQSLDLWHLAEDFASQPVLGDEFIRSTPPLARVLSVTDESEFIGDFYFKMQATRPMPMYSVPGLVRI